MKLLSQRLWGVRVDELVVLGLVIVGIIVIFVAFICGVRQ